MKVLLDRIKKDLELISKDKEIRKYDIRAKFNSKEDYCDSWFLIINRLVDANVLDGNSPGIFDLCNWLDEQYED